MPKPRYSPPSAEVEARIKAVVELYRCWQEAETEYKQALTDLTDPNRDAVPIAYMANLLDVERKTVYRHTGRSMT